MPQRTDIRASSMPRQCGDAENEREKISRQHRTTHSMRSQFDLLTMINLILLLVVFQMVLNAVRRTYIRNNECMNVLSYESVNY